jgi:4'-phosphopantetheinyl transferase
MVICCYSLIDKEWTEPELRDKLQMLPEKLRKEALLKWQWIDRQLSIVGKLLLGEVLRKFGLEQLTLNDLKSDTHHRPYFEGNIDFNISHSGNLVICCGTDKGKTGIDAEQVKAIDLEEYTDYFTTNEWSRIRGTIDPSHGFFDFWTRKEAVLKAIGTGFHTPLSSVDVANETLIHNNTTYYIQKIDLHDDYCCNIAITQKQEINAPIRFEY